MREIVDTCDFFLGEGRRLYGQTVPCEMPDKALVHLPQPGRRRRRRSPRATSRSRCRRGTSCRRCSAATRWSGSRPSTPPRAATRWPSSSSAAAACRPAYSTWCTPTAQATFDGLSQALDAGLIDKVGFTGSSAVGARIGELCGRHLQSPCLELGGKNPMVVTPSADLDLAVEGALFSGFGTAGQRCTSLGTVIVHESRPRRLPRAGSTSATRERRDRRPDRARCSTARCSIGSSASSSRTTSTWIQPHHTGCSARPRPGGSPPTTRARASSATPTRASSTTRSIVDGVAPRRRDLPTTRRSARWSA